jgi:type I restriction enzyme S subunit
MVEWRKIEDSCRVISPSKKLVKELYAEEGLYPIIDQGQKEIVGYTNDCSAIIPDDEYVLFGDHTRYIKYHNGSFAQGADGLKILKTHVGILPRYFYYAFSNVDVPSRGYSRHWTIAKELLIPIPSMLEQQKIAEQLDTFTSSIENLKEQIALRRKQYEYYRDQLLDLEGKEGTEMKIADFCLLKAGKSISSEDITENESDNSYPCIGGNGKRGYVSYFSHEGAYPIIGRQGALCGCVNWITGKFYATEHAVVAKGSAFMDQRFLFYLFENANLNQYKTQGAQPGLSVAKLNEVRFIIPPLAEQQRIVGILDVFEESIQNLEAQLAGREKQYEYYRNKLLTFE